MTRLDGRVVAVTGAGRGLGQAYAVACAGAGAGVVVNDVDQLAVAETLDMILTGGGQAVASGHSVSDPGSAEALVDLAIDSFGALDGLVNNAGLFHIASPQEETAATATRSIEVNLLGPVYCALAAIPRMRAGGTIVNVTSGAALGMKGLGIYGAGKAGVMALTRAWALELDPERLAICAVSPVAVTRMLNATRRDPEGCAAPEALAPLVVYLLAGGARAIHGLTLRMTAEGLAWVGPPRNGEPFVSLAQWRPADFIDQRVG